MDQESIEPARGQHAPEDPIAEPARYDSPAASEAEPRPATAEAPRQTPVSDAPQNTEQPTAAELPQIQWQPTYQPPSNWQHMTGAPQQAWQPGPGQPQAGWQQPAAPVANLPQSTWQPGVAGPQPTGQFPPMAPMPTVVQQVWPAPAEPWHPPLVANADLPPGWHAPLRTDLVPVPPRKRRSKRLVVITAAVVVLLVAGVTTWLVWPPDRSPFEQAVANLAAQPVANYRADLPDGSQFDGRVTNQGDAIGTMTGGGLKFPFLVANGKLYVQLSSGLIPPGLEGRLPSGVSLKNRWATGDLGDLSPLLKQDVTPSAIAGVLRDQVTKTDKLPTPDNYDGTTVNNVEVLKADTPDGTLYVAKNQPYRVVRWIDKTTRKAAAAFGNPGHKLQLNGARASYTGLGTATFTEMNDDFADQTYDEMETDIGQLGDAINTDVHLTKGDIVQNNDSLDKCVQTGCSVTAHFTASPRSSANVPAQVSVQMNADVFLNDLPAGSCSSTTTIASTGVATLSCVDKDMKGPFDEASAKAKADAQAHAIGGYYSWIVQAKVSIYAVPLAAVDTVAEGKRMESYRPDHACGWTDKGGAGRDPKTLDGDFTARFDTARFPDFELHVFRNGKFYGDFGPSGWFAKNGGRVPTDVPATLATELKTLAVTFMRAQGTLKDGDNTDGDNWKRPAPQC
ncbi:hypothetical protein [Kutzneria sp. CA-103260]|uniref:hypothetical protein n=1 Tax=Kutzneria sp. CA-103260 TaxID=2802641 RepID=UPI001BAD81C0|nr:hypothetical protein [Kutzneria sp. CA-103260]QUQ63362.1 hypothetical protein JJ691_10740 [Kutzneria sp. CA-103260]